MEYYLKPPIRDGIMDFEPLDMDDLSGAFYLLALGLFISFLMFLCEKLVFHIKTRRQLKQLKNVSAQNVDEPVLIFPELLAELPKPLRKPTY